MIEDLNRLGEGTRITSDVCIVGAGIAGITMARELGQAGLRVCLVEGGGLDFEPESQSLYDGECSGESVALDAGRLRFFGGSGNHWGGRCATFDPLDFRRRDWIPFSGWPIELDELRPYYERAMRVAGFDRPWQTDAQTVASLGVTLPAVDSSILKPFLWRYASASPPGSGVFNWGLAYRGQLESARNLRVLLHANFHEFALHESDRGQIRELTVVSLTGRRATIAAGSFVLSCGGIENARLLMLSAVHSGGGFGSDHDALGRHFAQHSMAIPATILSSTDRMATLQQQYNILTQSDGHEVEIGLALSAQTQESHRILNCSAYLDYLGDPDSGLAVAQDVWRSLLQGHWPDGMGKKAADIATDLPEVWRGLRRRLAAGRTLALEGAQGVPSNSAQVRLWIEQAPDPRSRITLSSERDRIGLQRVKVDWHFSELERTTAATMARLIGVEFARLDIGRMRLEPWVLDAQAPLSSALSESYHHTGSTRMSDDPAEGVVGPDCLVHGTRNLYVAGSSVFSTAGHVSPTFTIVALAIRLADHLRASHARLN